MKCRFWPSLHIYNPLRWLTLFAVVVLGGCGSGTQSSAPPVGPSLSSIQVIPHIASVLLSENLQFTASGTFSDGTTKDITKGVTWTSSGTSAVIGNRNGLNGFATGIAGGIATITASQGTIQDTADLTVSAPLPRLAYAGVTTYRIRGFSVDSSNGLLTETQSFNCSITFCNFVLDRAGTFAYVSIVDLLGPSWTAKISRLIISPSGQMSLAESWPLTGGSNLQIDPLRRFLFAAFDDTAFAAVPIDSKTGEMNVESSVRGSFPCRAQWIVERTGKFVYYRCSPSTEILSSKIDPKTGALTGTATKTPVPKTLEPESILIHPTDQFMYFLQPDQIAAYSINAETGALAFIDTYATTNVKSGAISADGKILYVTGWSATSGISGLSIDAATGRLQELPWSPIAQGSNFFALAVDPSGLFFYAQPTDTATVSVYAIDKNRGFLTNLADQDFTDGAGYGPGALSFAY